MREMLTRKIFGKVPVWTLLLVVMIVAYLWWRKRRSQGVTGSEKTNPAEAATDDPTSPFPYSSPDMFPLQGAQGPTGPVGPAGPSGSPTGTAPGIKAVTPTKSRSQLMADYRAGLKRRHPTYDTQKLTSLVRARFPLAGSGGRGNIFTDIIGNVPAYNSRFAVPNSL